MKLYIGDNERAPFFELETEDWYGTVLGDEPIELTDEEYADYQRVMKEFEAWQFKLQEAVPFYREQRLSIEALQRGRRGQKESES